MCGLGERLGGTGTELSQCRVLLPGIKVVLETGLSEPAVEDEAYSAEKHRRGSGEVGKGEGGVRVGFGLELAEG